MPPSGPRVGSDGCCDRLRIPHYDLVVLDCPPSISLASEAVFDAADSPWRCR